jgi:glutamate-5-semialdehyde dehydrogenase
MSLQKDMLDIGEAARDASRKLAVLTARRKNSILTAMATELEARKPDILEANKIDLAAAEANDISGAMLDRLELTDARFACMIKGVLDVVALKDPVGKEISEWIRPNGLAISKVRVPIGVIGIIYESRPNVTVDASVLCFKSSNAVILRGGSECIHTNKMLALILQEGGEKKGLPPGSIQLIQTTRREAVKELVQMDQYVDLIMPRGGESLITAVTEMATVPVIKHYNGICHTYIDKDANLEMALDIAENAKCQRPGVCNAMETLLVHEDVAKQFLPRMATRLVARGVEMRGDERSRALVPEMKEAVEEDWDTEHLDLILGIRVVSDLHAAS